MTIEQALTDYVENSKVFEKPQPREPAWLVEERNPSPCKKELEEQLTTIINEKEPRLLDNELNILLSVGPGTGISYSISKYIYWLGKRASQVGAFQAISELYSWFGSEKVDAYYAVVALGPRIKMPIKVNDKITLYPDNQLPDSNALSDLPLDNSGLAVFHNDTSLIKAPVIVAWEETQLPRVYEAGKTDRSKMRCSHEKMEDAIRLVSVVNRMHYYIHRRTSDLRAHVPFSEMAKSHRGSKSDVFFADIWGNHSLDIQPVSNTENYQEMFDDIWQNWKQCNEDLKVKIRLAIDRWSQSQHRATDEDKAIEMRIALEALLIKKEQVNITSTIANKVKLMFPDNGEAPCKLAYDIYNAGSRTMHNGRIPNSFEKKSKSKKSPGKLLKAIHRDFPQWILYVIENGVPVLPDNSGWTKKIKQLIRCLVQR